eukprot:scaffold5951_cov108-Isochrysis_galbana.AAC.3
MAACDDADEAASDDDADDPQFRYVGVTWVESTAADAHGTAGAATGSGAGHAAAVVADAAAEASSGDEGNDPLLLYGRETPLGHGTGAPLTAQQPTPAEDGVLPRRLPASHTSRAGKYV